MHGPATAEIDRLDQPQAVEHFRSLHSACGSIEASPASRPPEGAANVRCAVGSWGGRRPSLVPYVPVTGQGRGHRIRRAFILPILDVDGELLHAPPSELRALLESDAVRFHAGCIRGAYPRVTSG